MNKTFNYTVRPALAPGLSRNIAGDLLPGFPSKKSFRNTVMELTISNQGGKRKLTSQ